MPQPAAPTRATSSQPSFASMRQRKRRRGGTKGDRCYLAVPPSAPYLRCPMPLPSFGFGHRPSWEREAPERGRGLRSRNPSRSRSRRAGGARSPSSPAGPPGWGEPSRWSSASSAATWPSASSTCPGATSASRRCSPRPRSAAMGVRVHASRCDVRDRDDGRALRDRDPAAAGRRPLPGQQRRHRQRRGALAAERRSLARGAGHQRHRRVQLHPLGRADLPAASTTARS